MQRLITQLKVTSDIHRQSLQTAYENLLKYKDELSHGKPFTHRKFIELAELQRSLIDVQSIVSEADSQPLTVSLEKFKQFLNARWLRIKLNSNNTYIHAKNYPQTQLCLAIAEVMHAESPNQYSSIDQLMMPDIKLEEPLGTFILSEMGTKQMSLSILPIYCDELLHTFVFQEKQSDLTNDLNRIIHCTKEGLLLYQAAVDYQRVLSAFEKKSIVKALWELRGGLQKGILTQKHDGTVGVAAYLAMGKFSEIFNALPSEIKNDLLKIEVYKKLCEKLSTPDNCIQTAETMINSIINALGGYGIDDAALEEAEYNYQQYLKLFNERLSSNSLIWNKNFHAKYDELLPQIINLLKEKKLINEMIASSPVAAYLINKPELLKRMSGPELQEWLALFQKCGLAISDIQSALLNLVSEIKFDKEFCQTLLSLGCDFQTIYQAVKRDELKSNMLAILFDLMPDKKEWVGLMRNESEKVITDHVMQCMNKSGDLTENVQKILRLGCKVEALFNYAISNSNLQFLNTLFLLKPDYFNQQFKDKHDYSGPLMHVYFSMGCLDIIDIMIKAGIPYDMVDAKGDTLLTYAAKNLKEYDKKFAEIVKLCPDLINKPNKFSETPLSIAVVNNSRDKVEILLQEGCDLNTKHTCEELTPLDLACRGQHSRIARWLVEKGASGDMQMIMKKYIHQFILAGGTKDNVVKAMIKRDDFDFTLCDENGYTPLMIASNYSNVELQQLLLAKERAVLSMKTSNTTVVMPRRDGLFATNSAGTQPQNTSANRSTASLTKNH